MARSALAPLASLGYFSGLDNVADPVRMRSFVVKVGAAYKNVYPLVTAMNVEIDNTRALKSRDGQTLKASGTAMHSLWSNLAGIKCFFVDQDLLYKLNADYSKVAVGAGFTGPPVSYAEVNDRIYFTNSIRIGYIEDDTIYSLPAQTIRYKQPLPTGQIIAYYRTRLYVAKGNVLYISDPLSDCYDVRKGYRQFGKDISMVRPVEDGIYVSDDQTWFLKGRVPEEMEREWVDNVGAIRGTDVGQIDGQLMGEDGMTGHIAMWSSTKGIYIGDGKGGVKNITIGRYIMPSARIGSAVFRTVNGVSHYLVNFKA